MRAWYNPCNEGAIRFYKRFGFMPSEIIEQEKIKKDQSGTFIIQKRYFFQKL
ncbi:hypothetical protein KY358_00955 [Candidatus Woesearchaeota archaeon]|nr:hypothetical protein [Candidatus Woesearchaeota archaeon]